jgi:hypothetical protein
LQQGGLPVEIERLEGWESGAPDALAFPEYFDGIAFKRVIAYFIDALIILAIMGGVWIVFSILTAMSLGLLAPLLWPGLPLVPLLYHTLTIGADDSATYGMRLLGVTVRTWDGRKPGYLQAALNTWSSTPFPGPCPGFPKPEPSPLDLSTPIRDRLASVRARPIMAG